MEQSGFCMKRLLVILLLFASTCFAQKTSNPNIQDGAVEITPWVGGGTGVGASSDFKFFETGVRVGKDYYFRNRYGTISLALRVCGRHHAGLSGGHQAGRMGIWRGIQSRSVEVRVYREQENCSVSRSKWRRTVLDAAGSATGYIAGEFHVGRAGRVSLFREREAGNHVFDASDSYFKCEPWESQPWYQRVRAFPAGIYDFQIARHSCRTDSYEHSC